VLNLDQEIGFMQIRQANSDDIIQLIDIRLAYLAEDHGGLSDVEIQEIKNQLPAYYNNHLQKDLFIYICKEEDEIISSVFLISLEKPASPVFLNGKSGMILNVYTRPEYRKRGIAGMLMKEAIEEARERGLSFIELKATKVGESLYKACGFVPDNSKYLSMRYNIR